MRLVCGNFPLVFRRRLLKRAILHADHVQKQYNAKQRVGVIDVCHKKEQAIAWELVEELSSELNRFKERDLHDPLEEFCETEPDALECRIYDV